MLLQQATYMETRVQYTQSENELSYRSWLSRRVGSPADLQKMPPEGRAKFADKPSGILRAGSLHFVALAVDQQGCLSSLLLFLLEVLPLKGVGLGAKSRREGEKARGPLWVGGAAGRLLGLVGLLTEEFPFLHHGLSETAKRYNQATHTRKRLWWSAIAPLGMRVQA
jgi:hypothetical protein